MNTTPPRNIALPVLTERLVPPDAAEPAPPGEEAAGGWSEPLDAVWARIEPRLREQLNQRVRGELDALAPQLSARMVEALGPLLRQALAEALAADRG